RLVLGTIYDRGPISRAAVARATGLTRTTVSDVVTDLLREGLAREIGRGPSTGGKAPILLEVTDDARHLVGLDLGEKVFRGAIVDLRGEIVSAIDVPVDDRDGGEALERVFGLVDRLLTATDRPILGIGIGTAGLIDTTVGAVLEAVNLDWHDVPLGALLRARTGLPVYVANDSQATALAEHVFGGPRTSNLVVVKVGEGIGAGLVLDGRLFQGDGFGAGEIGHTTIRPDGILCRCGRLGCLETVASTRAILARLVDRGLGRLPEAVAALEAGDSVVRDVVTAAGRELGVAVAWLVGALNVERVVLVGSAAEFGEPWLDAVRETMRRSALGLLARNTTVEIGRLHDDGVVLGASALLMTRELGLSLAGLPPDPDTGGATGPAVVADARSVASA
ncbi:MAG TPA: ROK family transcriptional regulator, partial [Candidatus Acidoferrum sp.]|nr:ROK family transcriptional regulator [Candidatus Acidoferrum sp.]